MPKNKPTKPRRGAIPLGRGLMKGRKQKIASTATTTAAAVTSGLNMLDHGSEEASKTKKRALVSVTEVSDLEDFVHTAVLADSEFSVVHSSELKVVVDGVARSIEDMGVTKEPITEEELNSRLTIPRRPSWTYKTTPNELDQQERDAFLKWRREMAALEEETGVMCLTPFERNIEVWRQLWRVVERSDIVVQLIDARNPTLFRCPDLEKYVHEHPVPEGRPKKRNMLLLNKSDLLTPLQRSKWADYYRSLGLRYIFYSAVSEPMSDDGASDDSRLYGPSGLLDLFRELSVDAMATGEDGRAKIGLVGYPNVGKSSCINSLFGEKRVRAGATPGKTKHLQTLNLTDDVTLVDCPGLVFPSIVSTKAELICNGILPIDQLRDHFAPIELVCRWVPVDLIERIYGFHSESEKGIDVLSAYCLEHGMISAKARAPHWAMGARIFLRDFTQGKLLYCHSPPGYDCEELFRLESRSEMEKHMRRLGAKKVVDDSVVTTSIIKEDTVPLIEAHTKGKQGMKQYRRVTHPHEK